MARFLLILVLLAFAVWAFRNFLDKLLYGGKRPAQPVRRPHKNADKYGQKPVDLVRDEKTGQYRIKED